MSKTWIAIVAFRGEHRFLSNFYPSPVYDGKLTWPTVEHAYQAAKCKNAPDRAWIMAAETPSIAKSRGRLVELVDGWEAQKIAVMKRLVKAKFSEPEMKAKLLGTGDAELVEGNYWGDTFWGVCRGVGRNELGKLLMAVREELRG